MLFGRPTALWVGLITAAASTAQVFVIVLLPDVDPVQVATVIGSLTAFLGVFVAFLANGTPTVTAGDSVNVITPAGQDNKTVTVQ